MNETNTQSMKDVIDDIRKAMLHDEHNENRMSLQTTQKERSFTLHSIDKAINEARSSMKAAEVLLAEENDDRIEVDEEELFLSEEDEYKDEDMYNIVTQNKDNNSQQTTPQEKSSKHISEVDSMTKSFVQNNVEEDTLFEKQKTSKQHHDTEAEKAFISEESKNITSKALKDLFAELEKYKESSSPRRMSVEELVVDMLKPELSKWLDKNLPDIVRETVKDAIKEIVEDIR